MAKLTHTVSDNNVASFRSADIANIESLKCHFLPVLEGSGDPSPENVRPISGWLGCNIYKTGKNIGHVIGYSVFTMNKPTAARSLVGNYGTTISTVDYNLPDTSLTITQTEAPNTSDIAAYANGYFCIGLDNLIFDLNYDVSFKVTNITNNLLNVSIDSIRTCSPGSSHYKKPDIVNGNTLVFRNVSWKLYTYSAAGYERCTFEIRNAGLSFTLSEFMVTPVGANDGVFEPYNGNIIPIIFPNVNKNKFEITSLSYDDWTGEGYINYYLDRMNPIINTTNKTISITCQGSGDSVLYKKTHYAPGTYTLSYDMTYSGTNYVAKRMVVMCFDENNLIMTDEQISLENLTWNKYYKGFYNTPRTFTVPNTVNYFTICFGIAGDNKGETATFSNILLEVGSTATAYEPYNYNNSLCGGYIDVATGEIYLTWLYFDLYYYRNYFEWVLEWGVFWIDPNLRTGKPKKMFSSLSNVYPYGGQYNRMPDKTTGYIYYYDIAIRDDSFNGDLTSFKASIQEGQYVVYELDTPIFVAKLSSLELQTLIDYNNIWSNTNNTTEVTYEIIDHLTAKRANIPRLKAKVIWNSLAYPQIKSGLVVNSSGNGTFHITCTMTKADYYTLTESSHYMTIIEGHKYYIHGCPVTDGSIWLLTTCGNNGNQNDKGYGTVATFPKSSDTIRILIRLEPGTYDFYITPVIVDLTQMFGAGNEPTLVEFEQLCKMNGVNINEALSFDLGTEKIWYINNYDITKYKTVEWNQLDPMLNSSNWEVYNSSYASVSFDNGVATRTVLLDAPSSYSAAIRTKFVVNTDTTHKYYIKQELYSSVAKTYVLTLGANWCRQFAVPAEEWTVCEVIGAPISSEKIYAIYDGNNGNLSLAGYTCKLRNPLVIDLTQMFGAGNEPTLQEFRALCTANGVNLDSALPRDTGTKQLWIT